MHHLLRRAFLRRGDRRAADESRAPRRTLIIVAAIRQADDEFGAERTELVARQASVGDRRRIVLYDTCRLQGVRGCQPAS